MRFLIYGAGAIGTLFAEKLFRAGHEVTVLARGQRLADLQTHGMITRNVRTGEMSYFRVNLIEELQPEDRYDLTLIAVPKPQLGPVLQAVALNTRTPNILVMANTAESYDDWKRAIGDDRLLVGFPGAGGTITNGLLRYALLPPFLQKTTLGEVDGSVTERLQQVASLFTSAGIPATCSRDMHAWQVSHAVMISCLSGAVFMAGSAFLLPRQKDALYIAVHAVREGYRVMDSARIPVTPARLKLWRWLPTPLAVRALRAFCRTEMFSTVMGHLWQAREELWDLANELTALAHKAHVPTPAMDKLFSCFGDRTVPVPLASAA